MGNEPRRGSQYASTSDFKLCLSLMMILAKAILMCLTPLLGAFVADQYLGRYNTLQLSNVFMLAGHVIIIFSAIPSAIVHRIAILPLLVGIILMAIGYGGLKSVHSYPSPPNKSKSDQYADPTLSHSSSSKSRTQDLKLLSIRRDVASSSTLKQRHLVFCSTFRF